MTSLIALVSSGKGTWGHVASLLKSGQFDKAYLICNEFAYENFTADPSKTLKLKFDEKFPYEMTPKLAKVFRKEIKDMEVAINLVSGSGVEHMALLGSVLKAGLGMRFVYTQGNEVKEIELLDEDYSLSEEEL